MSDRPIVPGQPPIAGATPPPPPHHHLAPARPHHHRRRRCGFDATSSTTARSLGPADGTTVGSTTRSRRTRTATTAATTTDVDQPGAGRSYVGGDRQRPGSVVVADHRRRRCRGANGRRAAHETDRCRAAGKGRGDRDRVGGRHRLRPRPGGVRRTTRRTADRQRRRGALHGAGHCARHRRARRR